MKNWTGFWIILIFLYSCGNSGSNNEASYLKLEGLTQGTSFHITYLDNLAKNYSQQIDSILTVIDNSLSVYKQDSKISSFNNCDSAFAIDGHFLKVFWKANEVFYLTQGNFDPTVKPLIDFWGFGGQEIAKLETIDSLQIDSLIAIVGIEKIKLFDESEQSFIDYMSDREFDLAKRYFLVKSDPRLKLDFNALAQGYTVDLVAEYLESKGVENYLVEIGGEVRVKGVNQNGEKWKLGVDKPMDESKLGRPLQAIVHLDNKSIATSGNYRKFYEKDGVKYSHTISAQTGYPVQHQILSATVIADDCMTADAFATAFMVMGHQKAITFLENHTSEMQGYLIYSDENGDMKTYITPGLEKAIIEKES